MVQDASAGRRNSQLNEHFCGWTFDCFPLNNRGHRQHYLFRQDIENAREIQNWIDAHPWIRRTKHHHIRVFKGRQDLRRRLNVLRVRKQELSHARQTFFAHKVFLEVEQISLSGSNLGAEGFIRHRNNSAAHIPALTKMAGNRA